MPTLWLTITSMVWAVNLVWRRELSPPSGVIVGRIDEYDHCGVGDLVSGICSGDALIQVFSVELGWLPTVGADSWRTTFYPP